MTPPILVGIGMIVSPCSVKTCVANGYAENPLVPAADVILKESRSLVSMFRETPLHLGHLRLMTRAAEIGAIILPPMPAFYHRPGTLRDAIRQGAGRVVDQLRITHDLCRRWSGP